MGDLSPSLGTECFRSNKQSAFEQKFGTTKGHLLLSSYFWLLCTTPVKNEIATKCCVLAKKEKNNSDDPPPPGKNPGWTPIYSNRFLFTGNLQCQRPVIFNDF